MSIKMYGPAFTESKEMVEREVPESDVTAFIAAGYKLGVLPEEFKPVPEVKEKEKPATKKEKGKG